MEISTKIEKEINDQINREFESAYIYLSMSAYFESVNLGGFASWMRHQAKEELEHAQKFYKFVIDRTGIVILDAISKPQTKWKSPLDAFRTAYEHEKFITGHIYKLVELAVADKDRATQVFLNWFVDEQVEEEAAALDIVNKLEMIGDSKNALFMLNAHLGRRE